MFNTPKSPVQSWTIRGAVLAIAGAVAPLIASKLGVTAEDVQTLINYGGDLITIIGGVMAVVGRYKADAPIAR